MIINDKENEFCIERISIESAYALLMKNEIGYQDIKNSSSRTIERIILYILVGVTDNQESSIDLLIKLIHEYLKDDDSVIDMFDDIINHNFESLTFHVINARNKITIKNDQIESLDVTGAIDPRKIIDLFSPSEFDSEETK